MDIEQVKQAFIKADDLAQKGDATALEDAKYFANIIKTYKPQEEKPSIGKRLMAGPAAVTDFVLNMAPDMAAGLYGLGRGAVESALTDKSFSDAGADAVRAAQEKFSRNVAGKLTGTEDTNAYRTAEEALATPAAAGTMAIQGLGALGRLPFAGLEETVKGLEEPWRNPITSTVADTAGPLLGYGLTGKAGRFIADKEVQVKPFDRPVPEAEPLPPEAPPSRLVDPEIVRKEGLDVVEDGKINPYEQSGDFFPGEDIRRYQQEADVQASTWETNRRREADQKAADAMTEANRRAAMRQRDAEIAEESRPYKEQKALDERLEAERQKPLEFGLELEDKPLREEARLSDNDRITREREQFPTVDIDLLPEKVSKDSIVKGLITRWNNEQAKLRELYRQANEIGMEGTRVRMGELGTTKKAKGEVNALREEMAALEAKLENLSRQLQNRMSNKHGIDVEGLPMFKGVLKKGVDEQGNPKYSAGKYSETPPSVAGVPERYTGLEVEKTAAPNMQRSPDAAVTGSEMVQKTSRPPLNKGPGGKQSGGIDPSVFTEGLGKLFKGASKLRPPKLMSPDKKRAPSVYAMEETRSFEDFWKQESQNAGNWKDINDSLFQKLIQGRFVAALAERANPLVRYVTHKAVALDRAAKVAKENALYGNKFVNNLRGWAKRIKSEDGALTYLESAKLADADKLVTTLLDFDNAEALKAQGLMRPTEAMLKEKGLNDAQVKAANAIYDQIGKLFDEWNAIAKELGKDLIEQLPGYIPHMWFGDYRVILRDKVTGEALDIRGVNNKYQRDALIKEMKSRFADTSKYKVDFFDASQNKYNMNDISAFQYAMSVLKKGSKEHEIMNSVYKDILKHRGFNQRSVRRKGVKGFAGSEGGAMGVKEFQKALDAYFTQGYNFIANQKKRMELSDVRDSLKDMENKPDLSNTEKFINEYVEHSTGAMDSQMKLIDSALERLGDSAGLGPSAVVNGIKNISSLASAFFLTSGKFVLANLVQPAYNWAKLRNISLDHVTGKGATRTMMQAYMETFLGAATSKTKEGLSWAKQNGYIDAKTLELMASKASKVNLINEAVYKGSKHTLGVLEQEAVRTPTFVMYDLMLRDVIKNDKERWKTAGALTDQYMVDYGKSESPFFYQKAGAVGEAVRPLKQYGHAYYGQLGEYAQLAIEDKQYSPLAGFLATQALVSGVKGLPMVGAAAAIINALNNNFGTQFETPEDFLLGSGMSSDFIFGPISTYSGVDISGSVSAPGIEDIWSAPGLSFAGNAALAAGQYARKSMDGTETSMDKMNALQKAFPNPHVNAMVERSFMDEQGNVPDPNNRGLPKMTSPRTESEWAARIGTGAQLTREQEEKAVINAIKRDNQRDSKVKKEVMDKIIDNMKSGKATENDIKKMYQEAGGDLRNLIPELKGYMKDALMGQLQRNVMKGNNLSRAQQIEKLREYSQILEDASVEELAGLYRKAN